MSFALIAAWSVRSVLLLLWIPFTILATVVRLGHELDRWSSTVVMEHKMATPALKPAGRSSHPVLTATYLISSQTRSSG